MRNWDLLREMNQMQRDIDSVFRGFGLGRLFGPGSEAGFPLRNWPHINLREDADHIYVEALLPGIEPDKVDMNVLGNTLTLSGERTESSNARSGATWHRRERGTGKFLRTIELPVDIDPDQVKAEYQNGLLMVKLPKVEAAKPKKISILTRNPKVRSVLCLVPQRCLIAVFARLACWRKLSRSTSRVSALLSRFFSPSDRLFAGVGF